MVVIEHRLTDDGAAAHHQIEHALGDARAHDDFGERMGGAGHEIGGLEQHAISVGERGRDLPGGDRDREIPGRDDADHADRLARHLDVDVGAHAGEFLAGNAQGLAGEEIEDLRGARDFADRLGQRLALFAREQSPQFFAPRRDFQRGAQQDVMSLLRRRARPGGEGRTRRGDRVVDLRRIGLGVFAHDVVGVRRIDVAGHARRARPIRRR